MRTSSRITDGLGAEAPEGLIVHLAIERAEGGLRYIDVWESEEDFLDCFADERLHPVIHPLLRETFGEQLPPEPEPRHPVGPPRLASIARSSEPHLDSRRETVNADAENPHCACHHPR